MFERILSLFSPSHGYRTPLPPADAKFALGALLVRVAQADHAYLFQEVEQIDRILARLNGINQLEAAKMRAQCERLSEELGDTGKIAKILHDAIDLSEREATLKALWQVVYADGLRHDEENAMLTKVQNTLGVAPEVCARLRAEVAAEAGKA